MFFSNNSNFILDIVDYFLFLKLILGEFELFSTLLAILLPDSSIATLMYGAADKASAFMEEKIEVNVVNEDMPNNARMPLIIILVSRQEYPY